MASGEITDQPAYHDRSGNAANLAWSIVRAPGRPGKLDAEQAQLSTFFHRSAHRHRLRCPACWLSLLSPRVGVVMLSFCSPQSRREFLRVGGLALGGLSLSQLMSHAGSSVNGDTRPITSKSVVFLFLHGGPSQIETFDPKMTAPDNIRSATGETKKCCRASPSAARFPSWPPGPTASVWYVHL